MKLNDPRSTLVAGLALALGLNVSAQAAGGKPEKPLRIAQGTLTPPPTPMPNGPAPGVPSLSPSASAPVPSTSGPVPINPVPMNPGMSLQPANPGVRPNPVPVARPPMGMLYGEQEMLDAKNAQTYPPAAPLAVGSDTIHGTLPIETATPYVSPDRFGYAPPPGTLGQTYKRRSRVIEDSKHPRVGAVEVHLPENVDVTAKGLKSKWNGKVWRLESDPLMPGIPHIYEIKASWGEGTEPQIRTVRLIMGRIVDLDF